MSASVDVGTLEVDASFLSFVNDEVLPGTGLQPDAFWGGMQRVLAEFMPRNAALLARRNELQAKIDARWQARRGQPYDIAADTAFLRSIGYLVDEPADVCIATADADPEIALVAGAQLVVPVNNARYALNAANARWGSLYDALYGTDALAPVVAGATGYDPRRGAAVIAYARKFLDRIAPLSGGRHADATAYFIEADGLRVRLQGGACAALAKPALLVGWRGPASAPAAVLLQHHGLHVEILIDRQHPIGRDDAAGIADLLLESALTTIQDCEDSVAAVDAQEKIGVYRNWLGLMRHDLEASFTKGDATITRRLNPDRVYEAVGGGQLTLPGRSLMLVRNVGHHMETDMVRHDGRPVFETLIDAFTTVAIALHDLRSQHRNSRTGSVYVVKPKLHGPEEVALANWLFDAIEDAFGLSRHTVKIGVMDEERRTSANLKACIAQASGRIVFINTGFLDRTGDEIHTAMEAGPVLRKEQIKVQPWIQAYEKRNVEIGIAMGFPGKAQIGKGMWAMPDLMAAMLKAKLAHPRSGASTAWVPSPTAATLHALHYHEVDVGQVQAALAHTLKHAEPTGTDELLTPPLAGGSLTAAEIQAELDNNIQGILGYVVRWIDQGVGCSKVPDIHDVGLMEDRATLRISSQHVANWLHHGICTSEQVRATFERMAAVVDQQNAGDPQYRPMSPDFAASIAFRAACELVFEGRRQPNGYTEYILHRRRREFKAAGGGTG